VKTLRALFLAVACGTLSFASVHAEAIWQTDFPKAQEEARTNHKLLLLNFTGSDWCGWCMRLEAEVFSKPEFAEYAKQRLVLVTVDFPRAKPLSDEVRRQNRALAEKYGVEGFPTIVVLNGDGKPVGALGYQPGGPSAFIEELKKLPQG
jgi:protein disulfide-isomerase